MSINQNIKFDVPLINNSIQFRLTKNDPIENYTIKNNNICRTLTFSLCIFGHYSFIVSMTPSLNLLLETNIAVKID
jgi:hypothetical protein